MSEKEHKEVLSTIEVADILGITRRTLNQYIKDKKIKAFRIGKEWRITRESMETFIEKNSTVEED